MPVNKDLKRLNYLYSELNAVYHKFALKLGVSDSVMQILYTVCSHDGSCLIHDICYLTGISKQTINSALRKLESEEIIYLAIEKGRNKRIYLTKKGQAFAEKTVIKIIEAENQIFKEWSEEKKQNYLALTQEYLEIFRKKSDEIQED